MHPPDHAELLHLSSCAVDLEQGVVFRKRGKRPLTAREHGLLRWLVAHPGEVFSRDDLLEQVWGQDNPGLSRAVDVTIRRLRQKIEASPSRPEYLRTVHGEGYRYQGEPRFQVVAAPVEDEPGITNLGSATNRFIGRHDELGALRALLDPDIRLVTLVGPPGVGKTRLARQFAQTHRSDYPGGVWFCDLTEVTTAPLLHLCVAHMLGLSLTGKEDNPTTTIGNALAHRGPMLMCVDNVEQVVEATAEALAAWVAMAPDVHWIATSRVRLHIRGEQVYPVHPLPQSAAVALFFDRAQLAKPSFSTSPSRTEQVEALVDVLEGMPLAIELAAARIHVLTLSQIRERLSNHLQLLGLRQRDVRTVKATLQGSIQWSWQLLKPWEQAALAQCSVFRGGFDLEAAEAMIDLSPWSDAPWPMDAVQQLVDHSLVRVYEPEGRSEGLRFGLYASIQAFAAGKLGEAGVHGEGGSATGPVAERATWRRHADWFMQYGDPQFTRFPTTVDDALARRDERDNLLIAAERSIALGWWSEATRACLGACQVLEASGPFSLGIALVADALRALPDSETVCRGHLNLQQGWLELLSGNLAQAEPLLHQGQTLAHASSDPLLLATALNMQGTLCHSQHDLSRALSYFEQALSRFEVLERPECIATVATNIGLILVETGQPIQAEDHLNRARALCTTHSLDIPKARALWNLGLLRESQGQLTEAVTLYSEALTCHEVIGQRRGVATLLGNLANLTAQLGDRNASERHFKQAIDVLRALGDRPGEGRVLGNLGSLYALLGQHEEAEARFAQALTLHRHTHERGLEGMVLQNMGLLYAETDRFEQAESHYSQAVAIARELNLARLEGTTRVRQATLAASQGHLESAQAYLNQAQPLLEALANPIELARLWCSRGQIALLEHNPEEAVAALAAAQQWLATLELSSDSAIVQLVATLEAAVNSPD